MQSNVCPFPPPPAPIDGQDNAGTATILAFPAKPPIAIDPVACVLLFLAAFWSGIAFLVVLACG